MELIEDNNTETITLRFARRQDFAMLRTIMNTFAIVLDEDKIDLELLMRSKEEAQDFIDAFFALEERHKRS